MNRNPKVDVVETYIKALNDHDLAAIEAIYTHDATVEDPAGTDPKVGIDAILGFYKEGFGSGIKAELTGPVRLAANYAVFPFRIEVESFGAKIDVIDQFAFDENNKVRAMTAFWGEENMSGL